MSEVPGWTEIVPPLLGRSVEVPDARPPLMLVFRNLLRPEAAKRVRGLVAEGLASGKPIVVQGAEVFQLLDGVWQKLA